MNEILEIARLYIEKQNKEYPFHPNYKYGLDTNPKEYFNSWFFNFKILPKKDIPKDKNALLGFGGAPGFIVLKENNKVIPMSWEEKENLKKRERLRNKLGEILEQITKEEWRLIAIKKAFNTNLKEALIIKEEFKPYNFSEKRNRLKFIDKMEKFLS